MSNYEVPKRKSDSKYLSCIKDQQNKIIPAHYMTITRFRIESRTDVF